MKPILFSAEMVRAIQDLRKTQTRRVIKDKDITNWFDIDVGGKPIAYIDQATGDSYPPTHRAKYQPGDILWVRETWAPCATIDSWLDDVNLYAYRANYGTTEDDSFPPSMFKWRPSIHMPREAARIFLEVTNVSVERLQDINEEDALKEGCMPTILDGAIFFSAKGKFHALWDSLNAKRGYGWEANPWVWVYEFERISKEEAVRLEGMK